MLDKLVLASKSPRRQELIKALGYQVEIRTIEVEETYPSSIALIEVPEFLAIKKSKPLQETVQKGELLITSDTIVLLNNAILGKPADRESAIQMLSDLSGQEHTVITGVSLYSLEKHVVFSSHTKVYFDDLTRSEIEHYVDTYSPMDKAGSYGIQEWIGLIGIKKIDGCYYNVMGLPVHDIYRKIREEF
ncbi:MAG: septum formation protein Maf [Bacteroidetes bacterium]|nr:MAG: septum formation protein Maf [Bacteroidota bacterium]